MASPSAAPLVLVVDDFREAREMYALSLELDGFRVAEASTAADAVARALADRPDVILMDLSLPGTDGIEATRQLKADPRTWHIPVLAISGHIAEGVARAAREAGCHGFILRPAPVATVVAELRRLVDPPAEPASAGPA
jgi:CheY-like chemotaxis protein